MRKVSKHVCVCGGSGKQAGSENEYFTHLSSCEIVGCWLSVKMKMNPSFSCHIRVGGCLLLAQIGRRALLSVLPKGVALALDLCLETIRFLDQP